MKLLEQRMVLLRLKFGNGQMNGMKSQKSEYVLEPLI